MYNEKIESLIKAALADGMLTEKEKQVLFRRAQEQGIDLDEFEMVLEAKVAECRKKARTSVDKCPACGAIRPAFTATCPECGYDFHDIKSAVVANLSDKLERVRNEAETKDFEDHSIFGGLNNERETVDKRKQDWLVAQEKKVIEDFPVPHTKEDVLELLYFIHPKVTGKRNYLTSTWIKKEKEIISRAKLIFANDKQTMLTITKFDKERKKRNGFLTWYADLGFFGRYFFWFFTVIGSIALIITLSSIRLRSNDQEVVEQLSNNQVIAAYDIYITEPDIVSEDIIKQLTSALIKSDELEKAEACLLGLELYDRRGLIDDIMKAYHKKRDIDAIERVYVKNKDVSVAYDLYISYAKKYRNYKAIKKIQGIF